MDKYLQWEAIFFFLSSQSVLGYRDIAVIDRRPDGLMGEEDGRRG